MSIMALNLKIIDHFDAVISDVDIEAETQLMQSQSDPKKIDYINGTREKLIGEIKAIKDDCDLRKRQDLDIDNLEHNEQSLFKEFCFYIEPFYLTEYG